MKTVTEMLVDADPLAREPRRSAQTRGIRRQRILNAAVLVDDVSPRRRALTAIAALTVVGIAGGVFQWSRASVDVVAAVRFEVRLAEEKPAPGLREVVIVGAGRTIYLHAEPVVVNGDITQAQLIPGDSPATFGVSVSLTADGGAKMLRATRNHLGRPIAILVDGEVIAAPVVRAPTSTSGIISGNFTRAEAERLVSGLLGR
jgi:preprotein translocase subunit SecD